MSTERPVTLLDHLRASDLLEPATLEELAKLPESSDPDPRVLGKVVLQKQLLTRFQVNLVAQGKAKNLRVGPYLILDKLGEGGMGQVYKAQHRHMSRIVALKVIRKEKLANADSVKRFFKEVEAAAQLHHPNIVVAFDAGQIGTLHYLAMEYIEGSDLSKQVKSAGPLPLALACEYVRQAALGLQHAHDKGMVHRDIKPHNLLVTQSGGKPAVKILDMGLARLSNQGETGLTQSGQVLGTPDYLSPEQAVDSKKADVRSDVYSLGCTLYYLLAGRAPFTGDSLTQVLLKHQMENAPPLRSLRAEVPEALEAVVARMMAKNPDVRFQSAQDLAEELEPFARGELPELPVLSRVVEPDARENSWATLDVGEDQLVRKSSRSSTRIQEEEDRPRSKKRSQGKESAKANPMKFVLLGAGVGVPLLGLLITALIVLLIGGKRKPDDNAQRPTVKDVSGVVGKDRDGGKDKGPMEEKDRANKDQNKKQPPVEIAELWTGELRAGNKSVTHLAISPRGDRAVTVAGDDNLRLWDLKTGQLVEQLTDVPRGVRSLAFSATGERLLIGSLKSLVEWDLASKKFVGPAERSGRYLSPDGKLALSVEPVQDPAITIYDVATGQSKGQLPGAESSPSTVRFSPDGKRVALVGRKGTIQVVAIATAREIIRVECAITDPRPSAACWTTGESELAVGFDDGRIRILDLSTAKPRLVREMRGQHVGAIYALALSPDGAQLLSGGADGSMRLWDLATGRNLGQFDGHRVGVRRVAFTPDGKRALSASHEFSVRVWDLAKPTTVPPGDKPPLTPPTPPVVSGAKLLSDFSGWVGTVAFSPDGKYGMAQDSNHTRIFELPGGKEVRRFVGHSGLLGRGAMTKDWKRLVTVGRDKTIRVWDVESGKELKKIEGHEGFVRNISLSADGKLAIVGAGESSLRDGKSVPLDTTFRLWDLEQGKELKRQETTSRDIVTCVALSPDGKRALIGESSGRWLAWDVENWTSLGGGSGPQAWCQFAFLPDGNEALVAMSTKQVTRFRFAPRFTPAGDLQLTGIPRCVSVTPDGKNCAVTEDYYSRNGDRVEHSSGVRVFDLTTNKQLHHFENPQLFASTALSADGQFLLCGDQKGGLWLWDLSKHATAREGKASGELSKHDLGMPAQVLALSPDDKTLVAASLDLRTFDVASGSLSSHQKAASGMLRTPRFLPDGRHVLTVSGTRLRVWDTKTAALVREFDDNVGTITCLDLSADGKRALTGGMRFDEKAKKITDLEVRVWDVGTGKVLAKLSGHDSTPTVVRFSGDGKQVVGVTGDGKLHVWDLAAEKLLRSAFITSGALDLQLSRDGKFAYFPRQEEVRIFELEKSLHLVGIPGPANAQIHQLVLFGEDRYLATATGGFAYVDGKPVLDKDGRKTTVHNTVFIYDLKTKKEVHRFEGHQGRVKCLAVSSDNTRLYSSGEDQTLRVWDLTVALKPAVKGKDDTPAPKGDRFAGHEGIVTAIALSGDGTRLVSGGADKTVRMWEMATGKEVKRLTMNNSINSVGFSSSGKLVCACDVQSFAQVWNAENGDRHRTIASNKGSPPACLILPDDSHLVTAGGTRLTLWGLGETKGSTGPSFKRTLRSVALTPEMIFVVGDEEGSVHFYDRKQPGKNQKLPLPTHKGDVLALVLASKGTQLISAGTDKSIVVRNLRTNTIKRLTKHGGPVTSLAVTPDGRWLVSGSRDKTVRLWRLGTFEEVKLFNAPGAVEGVVIDLAGKRILSCGGDGIREWPLSPEVTAK